MITWALKQGDRILQALIPPVPNRVCYRSLPDYSDNAHYVFRHALTTRNGLEHVWLLRDMTQAPRIQADFETWRAEAGTVGHSLRIASRRTPEGYWLHLRSRWIFHTHGVYRVTGTALRGRVIVNLWHGMPVKCIGRLNRVTPNPYPTFGTVHVATSHFFRYVIAAAFAVPPERVTIGALPRCDALRPGHRPAASRAAIEALLRIPVGRRWLLWMPTYRTEEKLERSPRRSFLDDLPDGFLESLGAACAKQGCTVVVKLHPFDPLNEAPAPTASACIRWLKAADWAQTRVQLYDLIAASDALISDISSVIFDYLTTRRPIGLTALDAAKYPRDLVFPIDDLLGSQRFDLLSSTEAIDAFVAKAAAGASVAVPPGDISRIFSQHFPEPGSEHILREVGL